MPDYSKGKIYTIRCREDPTLIYVGSTIQQLSVRLGQHKKDNLKYPNYLIYSTINNEWNKWYIELYELYPCSCKEELLKKEGEVIRLIGNLNMKINGRTKKEWYNDNKDKVINKVKKWKGENKDKVNEYLNEYRKEHKEEIKEQLKKYREEHKEESSEYYKINKEEILKNMKIIIECECGCKIIKCGLNRHLKTKKHINKLNIE